MIRLKDVMQTEVVAVSPDLSLRDLVGVFTDQEVTGAPVVANGRVVGVVSSTDLVEFEGDVPGVPIQREEADETGDWGEAATWREGGAPLSVYFSQIWEPQEVDVLERMETPDRPEWDLLDQYTVGDVMSRTVISLPSDAPLRKAAGRMLEADVHRILVVDDGELKGIVTTTDIVRAVADGKVKD